MIRPIALHVAVAMLVGLATAGGCTDPDQTLSLRRQLQDANDALRKAEREKLGLTTRIAKQQEHIDRLQAIGAQRMKHIFRVERIRLGRYTGGADLDGKTGDDGIKVYIQPIDQHGSIIKAAGTVKVQLFDLAAPTGKNLIFEQTWPAETIHKNWTAGLLGNHFAFKCRWKTRPAHDEITVRAEFVDYLTARRFTAQKACKVALP
jgi:hypothetical protein